MYSKCNGVDIWYEKVGKGKPIILLHGNGESGEIFDVLVSQLKDTFCVYAVDSRNHGKSEKTNDISYDIMAEDIKCFIENLDIKNPILYGFSDGGIISLLVAIKYPNLVSKIIASGANVTPNGLKTRWMFLFKVMYFFTRAKELTIMFKEPNISSSQLNKINIPVLLLAGSNDMIKQKHTEYISSCIKKCKLTIIPNESHGSYIIHSPKLYEYIKDFIF